MFGLRLIGQEKLGNYWFSSREFAEVGHASTRCFKVNSEKSFLYESIASTVAERKFMYKSIILSGANEYCNLAVESSLVREFKLRLWLVLIRFH